MPISFYIDMRNDNYQSLNIAPYIVRDKYGIEMVSIDSISSTMFYPVITQKTSESTQKVSENTVNCRKS